MPLSFASILGGMITLIGTPPNIVIAEFRGAELGEPYRMFDFAPVGLVCAVVGVAYVALIGWRLLPAERKASDAGKELFDLADYIAEVRVPEGSAIIGKRVPTVWKKRLAPWVLSTSAAVKGSLVPMTCC